MLAVVMQHIKNWFVLPNGKHFGTFTIEGGSLELPFLVEGQYFRIIGSIFNDGVYQYPATDLKDETFSGAVWALAVPQDFLNVVEEIKEFNSSEAAKPSAYTSESWGGYSYSKATDTNGAAMSWQTAFAKKLTPWRKI